MTEKKTEDHTGMALEEAEAWENYSGPKTTGGIGAALSQRFGRPAKSIRLRHQLFRAGSVASPLWSRIENGMSLYTAVRILQGAVAAFHKANPSYKPWDHLVADAVKKFVDDELAVYDASPWREIESPGGGTFKRRGGERRPPTDPAGPVSEALPPPRPTPPPVPEQPDQPDPDPDGLPLSQWAKIKSALDELLAEKASGLDPQDRERVRMDFDIEVRRSLIWLRSRVAVASKAAKGLPLLVVRRDVVRWCSVLHIDPPRSGQPVDPELLRKQFRAMSKAYHPDKNPGVTEMESKMRAVSEAYHGLLDHNASMEKE